MTAKRLSKQEKDALILTSKLQNGCGLSKREKRRLERLNDQNNNRSGKTRSTYGDKEASSNDLKNKVTPANKKQSDLFSSIDTKTITIALGPPGVGKTMVATMYAAELLHEKRFNKIILTRPIVEIGKTIGHLPGSVNEKYEPYLAPFKDYLIRSFGQSGYEARLNKSIIPMAINFCQGMTFDDSIILIDEVQNTTPQELFMILTRVGKNSIVILSGDLRQVATNSLKAVNGLSDLMSKMEKNKSIMYKNDVGVVEFTIADIVRSDIVGRLIKLYDAP